MKLPLSGIEKFEGGVYGCTAVVGNRTCMSIGWGGGILKIAFIVYEKYFKSAFVVRSH